MTKALLVLNAGSSSVKFAVYSDKNGAPYRVLRAKVSGIGNAPVFSAHDGEGQAVPQRHLLPIDPGAGHDDLIPALLGWLKGYQGGVTITAAGHRVVHGGRDCAGPAVVNDALLADLDALTPLAPLHQPHNLAAIRIVAATEPHLPQVACFDTSFHRTQDRLAQLFALPKALTEAGIFRFGFHGLSYEYIANELPKHLDTRANGRVIVAHLGNGASMCAMKGCRSVATSMGFTALDGLMMGRRCGALDPGIVLYLLNEKQLSSDQITKLLYEQSGLLGVSGISNNMAVLEANQTPEAQEAIDLFCYRAAGELAALATSIGGLDALVFTAGIGENSALIRERICNRVRWMGVALDADLNDRNAIRISSTGSPVDVLVLPTDEEAIIALATHQLTSGAGSHHAI